MKIINLRYFYPFYKQNQYIEVTDEVAALFSEFEHREAAYHLRTYRHKAYYSLDCDDGIEYKAVFVSLSPWEHYERKVTAQALRAALASLPEIQARRVYAHCVLGISKAELARTDGVSRMAVGSSIERGLKAMESFLKNRLF